MNVRVITFLCRRLERTESLCFPISQGWNVGELWSPGHERPGVRRLSGHTKEWQHDAEARLGKSVIEAGGLGK